MKLLQWFGATSLATALVAGVIYLAYPQGVPLRDAFLLTAAVLSATTDDDTDH